MIMKLLKLMQTFVMKKFLFLMVASVFKWFLPVMLQFNIASLFLSPVSTPQAEAIVGSYHPLYVSDTEFNHNLKEKSLKIRCKLFADDFENTLKNQYKTPIDIAHPKDVKQLEKYIYEYLQKHLQLRINGKAVTLQFIGYEKEEEAVWGYLQVNNVPQVKKIDVMNDLLYEFNNTQISIMHATVAGARKSTRLVFPDTQASFEW
jgi:hypothetical protein